MKNLIIDARWILEQAKISNIEIYFNFETPAGYDVGVKNTYYAKEYNPEHPEYTQENFWTNDSYVRQGFIAPAKELIDTFGEHGTEPNNMFKGLGFTYEPRSGGGEIIRRYIIPSTWIQYNEEMIDYLAKRSPNLTWMMALSYGGGFMRDKTIDITDKLRNSNVIFNVYGWYPFDYTIYKDRSIPQSRYKYSFDQWKDGSNGDWKSTTSKQKLLGYKNLENWRIQNNIQADRIYAGANTDIASIDRYKYYRDRFAAASYYGYHVVLGIFGERHYAFSPMYDLVNSKASVFNYQKFAKRNPKNKSFTTILDFISKGKHYSQSSEIGLDPELTDAAQWSLPVEFKHTKNTLEIENNSGSEKVASMKVNTSFEKGKTYQVVTNILSNEGEGDLLFAIGENSTCTVIKGKEKPNVYSCEIDLKESSDKKEVKLIAKNNAKLKIGYLHIHKISIE